MIGKGCRPGQRVARAKERLFAVYLRELLIIEFHWQFKRGFTTTCLNWSWSLTYWSEGDLRPRHSPLWKRRELICAESKLAVSQERWLLQISFVFLSGELFSSKSKLWKPLRKKTQLRPKAHQQPWWMCENKFIKSIKYMFYRNQQCNTCMCFNIILNLNCNKQYRIQTSTKPLNHGRVCNVNKIP